MKVKIHTYLENTQNSMISGEDVKEYFGEYLSKKEMRNIDDDEGYTINFWKIKSGRSRLIYGRIEGWQGEALITISEVSEKIIEVKYNTSSPFAMFICHLSDGCDDDDDKLQDRKIVFTADIPKEKITRLKCGKLLIDDDDSESESESDNEDDDDEVDRRE